MLEKERLMKEAAELVARIRKMASKQGNCVDGEIMRLKEICKKTKKPLKSFETSKKELKALLRQACQSNAAYMLFAAKEDKPEEEEVRHFVFDVKWYLKRGKLKPEDIGTTEEELQSLIG